MRFLSYNIHGCIGRGGKADPDAIVQIIQNSDADVVALQEVDDHDEVERSFLRDLERLDYAETIYGPTMRKSLGPYGNVLMSRHPAKNVERIDLSQPGREPRGAIRLEIEHAGKTVEVLSTHLGLWPGERRKQIECLIDHAKSLERSKDTVRIAMGDFNEWRPWSRVARMLHRHFGRSRLLATFPTRFPFLPLDRIWVAPEDVLFETWRIDNALARRASDHLPLMTEIKL